MGFVCTSSLIFYSLDQRSSSCRIRRRHDDSSGRLFTPCSYHPPSTLRLGLSSFDNCARLGFTSVTAHRQSFRVPSPLPALL